VSTDNARLNLTTELGALNYHFDRAAEAAYATWNELLGRVELQGREEDKRKFYTNYYRSLTGKVLMSDTNGQYVDLCEEVQTVMPPAEAVYSSDGLWGSQWTLAPFWTLVAPDYANRFANSLLELQRRGGWIPEAPVGLEYAQVMDAQHQNALLISLYQKGLHQFDPDSVLAMIVHDYSRPPYAHPCGGQAGNHHNAAYLEYGYVTEEAGGASNTMEYAFDDWCLAQFARALGEADTYATFSTRADNWRHHWDPETKYLRRRHADGSWYSPFDPFLDGTEGSWHGPGYMEGNAWVYTWYVPHDLPALVELLGRDTFVHRLEEGFRRGYVDLSNQPNLQAPFLFNYAGRPDLTQRYSRMVADSLFFDSPLRAYVGEEDEGQMGALYCLLSMGLFEMKAGCSVAPYYDLSSPVFDEVRIHRPGGDFIITAENNGPENVYIHSAVLDGRPLPEMRVPWSEIAPGGRLVLRMGAKPTD
jgi:predicted alpha-1,2-mannosidase